MAPRFEMAVDAEAQQLEQPTHLDGAGRPGLSVEGVAKTRTRRLAVANGDDGRKPLVQGGQQWPRLDDRLLEAHHTCSVAHDGRRRAQLEGAAPMHANAGNVDLAPTAAAREVDDTIV